MANKIEVVTATLNVSFEADEGDKTGAGIKLEIDDREDGLNGGETSFKPGDTAYFFMFVDTDKINLITTTPKTTAGGVSAASPATDTIEVDENISFSGSEDAQLGYTPKGTVTLEWVGGKGYELNKTTFALTPYSTLPNRSGINLKISDKKKIFGILNAKYEAEGSLWALKGVSVPEAMVIAIGTTKP